MRKRERTRHAERIDVGEGLNVTRTEPNFEAHRQRAREWAGNAKFRTSQAIANRSVPLLRSLRGIDTPIAERHLFVLAHPRSGSTVLAHVLNDHAEVTGYGEHHVSYDSLGDLRRLEARNAHFAHQPNLHTTYTMDKIVWNQHMIGPVVQASESSRFVFLIREPEATLESYGRMFHMLPTDADRFRSYRRRLEGLINQARSIDDPLRAFSLTYDELTHRTDDALEALSTWLELDPPLRSHYGLTPKTGIQSWGDPSDNIKAGKVLELERRDTDIDPAVREVAARVYGESVRILGALTTTVPAPSPG